ncbi:MAG TPA: OAM dimerization domain-containing protein [Bacillota bacterium]|nr:OAM dimerization domain-containing protein [Bacillota bacterium]
MVEVEGVRPYGDRRDDGAVQVSFTLPVPDGERAREAARMLMRQMGLEEPQVVFARDLGGDFTFVVGYGRCRHAVDLAAVRVARVNAEVMDFKAVNRFARERLGRKVVVVGACTGSDAHTLGLDAILSMKGFAGDYGLERYPEFRVVNLGSQVPNETLAGRAVEEGADAILVSQVVTMRDVHLTNLSRLAEMLEAEGVRDRVVLVCGGPRITHELAVELGYDAGFGPGTGASMVASFIVQELDRRRQVRRAGQEG